MIFRIKEVAGSLEWLGFPCPTNWGLKNIALRISDRETPDFKPRPWDWLSWLFSSFSQSLCLSVEPFYHSKYSDQATDSTIWGSNSIRAKDWFLYQTFYQTFGAHPACQWVPWVLPSMLNRLACEADYTLPSSAEVRNECSSNSIPPVFLQGVCRGNFTFTSNTRYLYVTAQGKHYSQ